MGVTAEQVQFYVHAIYDLLLGNESRRESILSGFEHVFRNHPKINSIQKGQYLALTKMARYPTITALIKPTNLLLMVKKHWHHRKIITSRLVPLQLHPNDDKLLDDHLVTSLLRAVIKQFSPDEIEKFYSLLEKIIQFAEPHAQLERWDQNKPVVDLDNWVPISQYIAGNNEHKLDCSESGSLGDSGGRVRSNENCKENKTHREKSWVSNVTNKRGGGQRTRKKETS